jgi:hypothetical protein
MTPSLISRDTKNVENSTRQSLFQYDTLINKLYIILPVLPSPQFYRIASPLPQRKNTADIHLLVYITDDEHDFSYV